MIVSTDGVRFGRKQTPSPEKAVIILLDPIYLPSQP
jgi:hypothetical protein